VGKGALAPCPPGVRGEQWWARFALPTYGYEVGMSATLRHSGAQEIVQMKDADRPVGVGDDQRGDLRRIEQLQRFAGKRVAVESSSESWS